VTERGGPGTGMVKCVVWDLDHTLLDGVYLESGGQPPPADPAMTAVLSELAGRGILQAVASRNPPEAADYAAAATGAVFVAAECGWDAKSAAITRIAAGLNIGTDAIAFVDDDPYERAEVSFALPGVLVLSPEDMAEAPGWPAFSPAVVTADARRRSLAYLARRQRQEAEREFAGSREEFLRWAGTEIRVGRAEPDDADRLAELSERTHQFNAAARGTSAAELRDLIARQAGGGAAGPLVLAVRLRDRFGDDGLVGACVAGPDEKPQDRAALDETPQDDTAPDDMAPDGAAPDKPRPGEATSGGEGLHAARAARSWRVSLLAMSCRAMGRGVIDALLAGLAQAAREAGAQRLTIPAVLNDRNVPLRLALAAAGFRATADPAGTAGAGRQVLFRLDLSRPDPLHLDPAARRGATGKAAGHAG
jgi:FkbH-like protein